MNNDPILNLALSLYHNPGIYALLIGSGVSKAAGIPTGWEIVLDLIRKIAILEGESAEPDPEKWFKNKYKEPPNYSKLLQRLCKTQSERMTLLRSYFEPTEEEKEKGLKIPTPAHKAISELIEQGYIRMILTTNFDRLIEIALAEIGITPDVISTEDALKGAMPYIHSKCYVVKLHGDYLDTRIKNTEEELANYSELYNEFLDRVFDEFGFVICGWSGEWDIALRDAMLRNPNRRLTTYWLVKDEPTEAAKNIIIHRRAEKNKIENANQFFRELTEKLKSLREFKRKAPISIDIAVATLKRYLSESKYRISLHDLVQDEVEQVYSELVQASSETQNQGATKEIFQKMMHKYEAIVERLIAMMTALSYYDTGENSDLLIKCINRLLQFPQKISNDPLIALEYYPALLVSYSSGISTLASKHFTTLLTIFKEPKYFDYWSNKKKLGICKLNVLKIFGYIDDDWIPCLQARSRFKLANNYLCDNIIRHFFKEYLPDDREYKETFDIFEYILDLTYIDLLNDSRAPIGRYGPLYFTGNWQESPIGEFVLNIREKKHYYELLKAGFFDNSIKRFNDVIGQHINHINHIRENKWM